MTHSALARLALAALSVPAALAGAGPAQAADRNYSVTSFDKVRIDGPYKVVLVTGRSPFAVATGDRAAIDSLAIDIQGRTLIVRANRASWGGYPGEGTGPVEIRLGTHDLSAAWINGAGSLDVDRIRGLSFDLAIQGSGSARIASADVDQLKVAMSGSGSASVRGKAKKLTAIVRGTSLFDSAALSANDATLGAEGPALVRATVTGDAGVDARGLASVELSGAPACTVRSQGSARVSGCR